MKTRISSRLSSWWKLHHGSHQALNIIARNRVCLHTGDYLSALTLQQEDNYLSKLSHLMLWCCKCCGWLQLCNSVVKFCHYLIITSSTHSYQEGIRAGPFGSCQKVEYFTKKYWIWSKFTQGCTHCCLGSIEQMVISYGTWDYHIMCTIIHCLLLQCLGEKIGAHRFLPLNFVWSCLFPINLTIEAHEVLSLLFWQNRLPPVVICDNAKQWSWWVQLETQGGNASFKTNGGIHPMFKCSQRKNKGIQERLW